MCSSTAFTTHYRGGAPRRRDAMRKTSFATDSTVQARAWADGDSDADHGLAPDGAGRSAHQSRVRSTRGLGAAAVRAPLLRIKKAFPGLWSWLGGRCLGVLVVAWSSKGTHGDQGDVVIPCA
jgi:hypothetical protein